VATNESISEVDTVEDKDFVVVDEDVAGEDVVPTVLSNKLEDFRKCDQKPSWYLAF